MPQVGLVGGLLCVCYLPYPACVCVKLIPARCAHHAHIGCNCPTFCALPCVLFTDPQGLAEWNTKYEAKFGHIFIICASGKSAEEMLAAIQRRWVGQRHVWGRGCGLKTARMGCEEGLGDMIEGSCCGQGISCQVGCGCISREGWRPKTPVG